MLGENKYQQAMSDFINDLYLLLSLPFGWLEKCEQTSPPQKRFGALDSAIDHNLLPQERQGFMAWGWGDLVAQGRAW